MRELGPIVVGALARVEIPAALWRKHCIRELGAAETEILIQEFEADFEGSADEAPRFAVVLLAPDVLARSASLVATYGMRAYDGVQLASALAARVAAPDCDSFACFDAELRTAAAAEGFDLLPA